MGTPPTSGLASINVGSGPDGAVYDPQNGLVYVLNALSGNVSIINGTKVIGSVVVGSTPRSGAYDVANQDIYVANYFSNSVSVIQGTRTIATLGVGSNPQGVVYDDATGEVYVVNILSNNVSVIRGTSSVGSVNLGTQLAGATYDRGDGYVYVAEQSTNSVGVLNGTQVLATIGVGVGPGTATYNPSSGYVYVSNSGSTTVSVLNGTTVIANVSLGSSPGSEVYDPSNGYMYVANSGSGLSVINGTHLVTSVRTGTNPVQPAFSDGNHCIYVPNEGSSNLSVVQGSSVVKTWTTGSRPWLAVYNSANGYVYVPNAGSANVSYIQTWSPATFKESGLPNGTTWWVNVTPGVSSLISLVSNTSVLTFYIAEGSFNYSLSSGNPLFAGSGGSFVVNGTGVTEHVTFRQVRSPVTFTESGLPGSTNWSVDWANRTILSESTSITIDASNGSYRYVLGGVPGWTTPIWSGAVNVNGSNVHVFVPWSQVSYPAKFNENGLPDGAGWWVNITLSPSAFSGNSTISVDEPNGSYTYSIESPGGVYVASGGSFIVNGTGVAIAVKFVEVTYQVIFSELGLPFSGHWSVTLGSKTSSAFASTIQFFEPNGSYAFLVSNENGFAPSPAFGSVTVSGEKVSQNIVFRIVANPTFAVTFNEKGLPAGENWSVMLNGTSKAGAGPIGFPGIENGSYRFTVSPVGAYRAVPASGIIAVNGSASSQDIMFIATVSSGSSSGGPSISVESAVLGAVLAVVSGGALVWLLRVRGRKTP